MAKIPFDLDKWLADKSQKVETRDGRPVRIICWDKQDKNHPIVALYPGKIYPHYEVSNSFSKTGELLRGGICDSDLFLFTPELTEFEQGLVNFLDKCEALPKDEDGVCNRDDSKELLKQTAAELLAIARKEIEKDLPRWEEACSCKEIARSLILDHSGRFSVGAVVEPGDKFIALTDLKKLPKED